MQPLERIGVRPQRAGKEHLCPDTGALGSHGGGGVVQTADGSSSVELDLADDLPPVLPAAAVLEKSGQVEVPTNAALTPITGSLVGRSQPTSIVGMQTALCVPPVHGSAWPVSAPYDVPSGARSGPLSGLSRQARQADTGPERAATHPDGHGSKRYGDASETHLVTTSAPQRIQGQAPEGVPRTTPAA